MPTPESEQRKAELDRDHDLHPVTAPRGGGGGELEAPTHLAPEDAWAEIDQILTSKDGAARLPALAADLDDTYRIKLTERMRDLLALSGDVVFDTLLAANQSMAYILIYAPYGHPPVDGGKVRAYLREQPGAALAVISDQSFVELRKLVPGALVSELPNAMRDLDALRGSVDFIRWLIDTTPARQAAHYLASVANGELAATLDAGKLWGWLDELHGAEGYWQLADLYAAMTDPDAKAKLGALLGPYAPADANLVALTHEAMPALAEELATPKATADELVELFARAGGSTVVSSARIAEVMRRAKATPDDVVQILSTMWSRSPEERMKMLLATPGVTGAHLLNLWWTVPDHERLPAMRDDAMRRGLRRHLGAEIRLRDLIDTSTVEASTLIADEGLRRWFIDEARPVDLLWLCGSGSPAECAKTCRILRADGRGLSWVQELTSEMSPAQLRVLANNCGDAKISKYLREEVIAEWSRETITHGEAEATAVVDRGSARTRLDEAVAGSLADEVLPRLADLDDAARAEYGKDAARVAKLLAKVPADDLLRACDLLGLTFAQVVAGIPQRNFHRGVISYLRTRPVEEEHAVLESKDLLRAAVEHVHPDPLITLPSLEEPKRLAAAIAKCPILVERMLAGSDPSRALRLFGDEPVRSKAAPYLAGHPEALDALPRYENLSGKGQDAFDRLEESVKKAPDHDDAVSVMDEIAAGTYEDGNTRAEERGRAADHAAQQTSLAAAVAALVNGGAETSQALAILHKFRSEVPALIADPARWALVDQIRSLIGLPPGIAFPDLGLTALVRAPNTRRWMFEDPEAFLTLRAFTLEPNSRITVAIALFDDEPGARRWLGRLPHGAGLTDKEEEWLDGLQEVVADAGVLHTLFKTRFGFNAPMQYDAPTMHQLYGMLARLPDAHIQQERITQIVSTEAGPTADGYWSPDKKAIVMDDDLTPETGTKSMRAETPWLTADQVRERYGFDEATLRTKVDAGQFVEQKLDEGSLYQLARNDEDRFTSTLLHEVGHAVDEILGKKTSVIYDRAGWKQYGADDFDAWATAMGGWDKVKAGDREKIKQAWVDSMFTGTAVKSLVPADHPALSSAYKGVGVVDDARAGKLDDYHERTKHGDHVFVSQPHYQCFYSIPQRTSEVAPSDYSMFAPEEYFAECYVEYYRSVDGTADGQRAKGGTLPDWIKGWFDEHVDRVRFDPRRMEKKDDVA